MKRLALTTAFIIAAAAPAFANDQLARSLGLEPGVYSSAELAQIKGALENRETDNSFHVQQLIDRGNGGVVSTQSIASAANDQLARSAGVEPGVFTTAEIAEIKGAVENRESDNSFHVGQLIEGGNSGVVSTQNVGGAGNAQLARSLGLEPGVYSDAELARIKGIAENRETDNSFHLKSVVERASGA